MRIATVSQRLCLITDGGAVDVQAASNGRFDADPAAVYPRWQEFTQWAATACAAGPGAVRGRSPSARRHQRRGRCTASA